MSAGGTSDRTIVPAHDAVSCKTNMGFSWLADKNVCAADCRPPAIASWDNSRNVPVCIAPQGVTIDETGARSDVNERGGEPNLGGGGFTPSNEIQERAVSASRQTDVFYKDTKTGLEIPAVVPTGYLITAGIGLALGFMFFRR